MPKALSVSAATMPAIQVPWPFGSVSGSAPGRADQPGSTDAVEVGVRGIHAGVEDGDGRGAGDGDRAVELLPADVGQRPLIGIGGVGRGSFDVSNAIGLDAEHAGGGAKRRELIG